MRFSVVIPSHRPTHLAAAVKSVLGQTNQDFEILLCPNNGAKFGGESTDPRIRVVPLEVSPNVGAVKRAAFEAARGEILVELDHDDLLAPQALERIGQALENADFAYSNFAVFRDKTNDPVRYDAFFGWKTRPARVLGKNVLEHLAFDPTPAAIGYIWYAPNHVRAWTREGYRKAGGHDPAFSICDDHDLVIRTYLTGRMARIDECLYLQREHSSTYIERNAEIQTKTRELYDKHIDAIVRRWCELAGKPFVELTPDLEGWPFAESSVGAFRAHDFLEHRPDKMKTLADLHRSLVPGGWLLSSTPSALGQGGFMDPTHVSYWVKNSFYYVTDRKFATYVRNETVRFQEQRLREDFPSDWHKAENIPYVTFDGVCFKDGYDGPGPHKI